MNSVMFYMVLWYLIGLGAMIFAQVRRLGSKRVTTYGDLIEFLCVSVGGPILWIIIILNHDGNFFNKDLPWKK